jgi:hypothetical protein
MDIYLTPILPLHTTLLSLYTIPFTSLRSSVLLCEGTHRNAHGMFLIFLEGGTCGCATFGISHFGLFSDSLR